MHPLLKKNPWYMSEQEKSIAICELHKAVEKFIPCLGVELRHNLTQAFLHQTPGLNYQPQQGGSSERSNPRNS